MENETGNQIGRSKSIALFERFRSKPAFMSFGSDATSFWEKSNHSGGTRKLCDTCTVRSRKAYSSPANRSSL